MCIYIFVFNNFEMKVRALQKEIEHDEFDTVHFKISQKKNVTDYFTGHFSGDSPLDRHDEVCKSNDKFDCSRL